MIQAVLFDMDGVLLDTEKYLTRYLRQAAKEAGYDMSREVVYSLRSYAFRFASPWLKEIYGEDFDYGAIRARRQELMKEHIAVHGLEVKPGVKETVETLRTWGYQTAVVTATNETRAREYMNLTGLTGLFDEVVCASMVEYGKPRPDVYLYACGKIGRKAEECIAVEDSPNGIQAAYSAGCRVIMVPDLTQPDEKLQKKTWAVAENLTGILPFVEKERKISHESGTGNAGI